MNRILMYHSIGNVGSNEVGADLYAVPVEKFIKQMSYLYELNKDVMHADNLWRVPTITFDDGLLNNYKFAYPILKDLGLKAYFFILPEKVGTLGYMNWEKIRELHDNGMIIGSHGMTHRVLTQLSDKELTFELEGSKKILEAKLHGKVEYFSIPRGFCSKKIVERVRVAGYKAVFTSNPNDNDGFRLGRIAVKAGWTMPYFIRVVNKGLPLSGKIKDSVKSSCKKILGVKGYNYIRNTILRK